MELGDLRAFVRIAELGSVSAAGRSLGLPKSTVSRALARLEAAAGAGLVDRSTRHLRLTDAGVLLRVHAARILAEVAAAAGALDGLSGVARGTLHVSAPYAFVVAVVSPMLPSFLARHPAVRVVIDVENRIIDMPVEAADLVIRVTGALPDSDLVARHLMTTEAWTCASPGYLAARGRPSSVAALEGHVLVGQSDGPATWSYRAADGGVERFGFTPRAVVSDASALAPALLGGAGIGRLPDFLARGAVGRGELVRLFEGTRGDTFEVHALYASRRSVSAKVRVFIEALVEHLATAGGQSRK